jgi:hypothetical protein
MSIPIYLGSWHAMVPVHCKMSGEAHIFTDFAMKLIYIVN